MNGISITGLLQLSIFTGLSKDLAGQDLVADICSQEEFHSILVREKARADRNGHGFSLVAIEASNLEGTASLTENFQQLIRTTDEIGWFDQNTLGIFLYNTSALGAWQFVNNSKKKTVDDFSISNCSVYSYPNEWCAF
jgi:hypothetical protein